MPWPLGKPRSPETKAKLSAASKGKRIGPDNPYWKGGKCINAMGYVLILDRAHPDAMPNGYVKEHRWIMGKHLGRRLLPSEHIHHKNGDITDNRLENLQLIDPGDHQNIHHVGRKNSPETRAKMSTKMGAFYRTPEGREIQRKRRYDQMAAAELKQGAT